MALDFFRIERGLQLDDLVTYLQGTGAPGAAGDTAAALVGSVYTNNADGAMYTKVLPGVGTNKWERLASEAYVNNAVGATVSWREPVVVRSTVSPLPVGTAASTIVVDGVTISDGERVLFSDIVGGAGKNIYIYDQASGLFVEDSNEESSGDTTYVTAGTSGGKTYIYNGSSWVLSSQTSDDELGYIRAFIGKSASGAEMPDYASNNIVSDSTSLETAIGALDTKLGASVASGAYIIAGDTTHTNIQSLDSAIGSNLILAGQDFVSNANTVNQNLLALDAQLGAPLVPGGNWFASGAQISVAINNLDQQLGTQIAAGNYVFPAIKTNQNIEALDQALGAPVVTQGVILAANSANDNIEALAAELASTTALTTASNVTTITTIDTAVAAKSAKWLVHIVVNGDSSRVYSTEVYALSNGVSVDFTRYATLRIGATIVGLVVSADYNAGDIRLRVTSTTAIDVTARRVGVIV